MKFILEAQWLRNDRGFIVDVISAKYSLFWRTLRADVPMEVQLTERACEGEHAGKSRQG
jgi:hypothetical protein